MRKLKGSVFLSLDGVMQGPGGPHEDTTGGFEYGGWIVPLADEKTNAAVMELFSEPFDLLLGRKTYEIFSAIWPFNTDNPIGAAIDRAHKYVLTGGNYPLDWAKSHRLRGIDEVRALKESDGPDLLIQGSAALYPQLLSANLSDELSILTFPVVCWGRASACSVRARRPAP